MIPLKTCKDCKTAKPLEDFYHQLGKPQSYCKDCAKKRALASYHKRRDQWKAMQDHMKELRDSENGDW